MAYSNDIVEITEQCFDYLLSIQKQSDDFYFVPRKINNKKRLEKGYKFIGNEKYLQISFWIGDDSKEKIHNIAFVIAPKKESQCYILISSRDNKAKANILNKLVDELERTTQKHFKEIKKDKWQMLFSKDVFYLDAIDSFIRNEKVIIDKFLKEYKPLGIAFPDKSFNEKYVVSLYKDYHFIAAQIANKKEGEILISISSYIIHLQHNKIQNALFEILKNRNDYKDLVREKNGVDIYLKDKFNQVTLYEIKTYEAKKAIRDALGQLLEYNHYPDETLASKLVVIGEFTPTISDIAYLNFLRQSYDLPLYYQELDLNKKAL